MLSASVQLYKNAYKGLTMPIWWLALVMFVNRSGTMVIPFLTVYLVSKGFSLAQAGTIMAAFGCGSILGSFSGGKLTDRLGFHYIQIFSLLLNGIMFFILGFMVSFWQIAICVFVLSSLGESFRPANAAAIAAYSNEENRTRCYALNRLATNLGWSIGPALGGILASISYSWLFWADGCTCILAALILYFVLPPFKRLEPKVKKEKVMASSPWRDAKFMKGMFFYFLVGLCFFQAFSITPVFFKESLHFGEATIGLLLALNGIVISLVEMVLVYRLENKRNHAYYIMTGAVLIGSFYLVLIFTTSIAAVAMAMLVITTGEMLIFPFMNSFWVSRSASHNRGAYASLYTMAFAVAQVVAPTLSSAAANRYGFSTLWVINFLICLVAGAGFFTLQKVFANGATLKHADSVV